jgi:malate permease and related proteins
MDTLFGVIGVFINTLLPVFVLVALGAWVAKPLDLQARTLSRLAYVLLIPAFVFQTLSTANISGQTIVRVVVFTGLIHVVLSVVAWWLAQRQRLTPSLAAACVLAVVFGNTGNMGLPLARFALGEAAMPLTTVYFLALLVNNFAIGVFITQAGRGLGWPAVRQVLQTPALLALWPAIAVNILDIPMPLPAERALGLLSEAMVPVMLLALGVQLRHNGIAKLQRHLVSPQVWWVSALRLLGGAGLAILLAPIFGISGEEYRIAVLQTAMPTAVLASIIATEHNTEPDFVMACVLASTLLALPTLSILLAWL